MPVEDIFVLGLTGINILLTIILLGIYYKTHRLVRSSMTLGMMFFAIAFLLENILDFYFYNSLLAQAIYGFTTFHLVVNFFEMAGLLFLLYTALK